MSGIVPTGTGPPTDPALAAPPESPEAPEGRTDPWLLTGLEAPAGLVVTVRLGLNLAIGVSLAGAPGAALVNLGLKASLALSPRVRLLLLLDYLDLDRFLLRDLSGP